MRGELMDRARFNDLAAAYGGDLERWPAKDRAGARALLAEEPGLQRTLDEAEGLDRLLDAAPEPAFSGMLRERILSQGPRVDRGWRSARRWMAGAGLAAACALGVLLGSTYSAALLNDPVAEALAQTGTSFDSEDLIALETNG